MGEKEFIICSMTDLPSKYTNKKSKQKASMMELGVNMETEIYF